MKIDVEFNGQEEKTEVTFFLDELKTERDFVVALSIIETFSADFGLDPELEPEELVEIGKQAGEKGGSSFVVEMSEEGIEVDINR